MVVQKHWPQLNVNLIVGMELAEGPAKYGKMPLKEFLLDGLSAVLKTERTYCNEIKWQQFLVSFFVLF